MRTLCMILVLTVLTAIVASAQKPGQKPAGEFAIAVKTTAPWHVAYQKSVGPYSGIPKAISEVDAWATEQGLVVLGPVLSEYYNTPMEVDSTKLEWAIMLSVLEPAGGFPEETKGTASVKSLDPMLVAYTYHQGPYDEVGAVYQRLFGWVFQNGYQPAGPIREIYWSNPEITPEDKVISELQIPVTKK